jgi:hypothetical protein
MDNTPEPYQPDSTDIVTTDPPTNDTAPRPFTFPESFTERFLWSLHQPPKEASFDVPIGEPAIWNDPSSRYPFSEELLAEVQAVASYNFINPSLPASGSTIVFNLGLMRKCPQSGASHYIVPIGEANLSSTRW